MARMKQFFADLRLKEVKDIMKHIDDHRPSDSKPSRDGTTFDQFKTSTMKLIRAADDNLPVFRDYRTFEDLDPSFSAEQWGNYDPRCDMLTKLCQNIVKLVGGVCFQTNVRVDAGSNAGMSSVEFDHIDKSKKGNEGPAEIAKGPGGAEKFRKAVVDEEMAPTSSIAHHRGADPHPERGDGDFGAPTKRFSSMPPVKLFDRGDPNRYIVSHFLRLIVFLAIHGYNT